MWYKIVLKLVPSISLSVLSHKKYLSTHAQQKVKLFPWAKTASQQPCRAFRGSAFSDVFAFQTVVHVCFYLFFACFKFMYWSKSFWKSSSIIKGLFDWEVWIILFIIFWNTCGKGPVWLRSLNNIVYNFLKYVWWKWVWKCI